MKNILLLLFTLLLSIYTTGQVTDTYTSSGTWTCPTGVTSITVECWGAGGGGGASNNAAAKRAGGGGGGGAYAKTLSISVTPGNTYTITVGPGGSGGISGAGTVGGNSTATFGASTVTAAGGSGGGYGGNGAVGAGGTTAASTGTTKYAGGNGAAGVNATGGGGGGGGAGTGGAGGNASGTTAGTGTATGGGNGGNGSSSGWDGSDGTTYGGGGGGGQASAGQGYNSYGGDGADGCVAITYTCPVSPVYATLPLIESFEGPWLDACATRNIPSSNWVNSPKTGANSWRRNDDGVLAAGWGSLGGAYSPLFSTGAYSARYHAYGTSTPGNLDLYVNCSPVGTKVLYFDYKLNSSSSSSMVVLLSTDGGATFPTTLNTLTTSGPWTTYSANITSTSATCVIRFRATGDFGSYDIGLDNVNIVLPCSGTPTAGNATASVTSAECIANSTLSLSGYSLAGGLTFQWQSSINGGTIWSNIGGATSTTYNATNISTTTLYHCIVTCSGSGLSAASSNATVTINPVFGGLTASSNNPICPGSSFTLSLSGNTTSGVTYQWQSSPDNITWSNIGGATSSSFTSTGTTTTYYRCNVTCTASTTTSSSSALLVTVNTPVYTTVPYSESFEGPWINVCNTRDAPTNNWINTPNTGNDSWRRDDDGSSASWSSATSYLYSPVSTAGSYSARFHSGSASAGTVGTLDLYINCSPVGAKSLIFDYTNTSGTDSMCVYISTNGGSTFIFLQKLTTNTGWATQTLNFTSVSATTVIRFKATADWGSTDIGIDYVNVVLPCSGAPVAGNATASSLSVCSGNTSNLSLTGNVPAGGLTFQWQSSSDNITFSDIASATTLNYIATLTVNTYYRCNVKCTASGITTSSGSVLVSVVSCYNMDDTPISTCAANFYDSGGPSSDYDYYEDYTKTFTASTSGSLLQVSFSSFEINDGDDYLYVYDGPTSASPQIPGSPFTGTTIPPTFSSSGSSITFYFTSDYYEGPGWAANISCVTSVPNCVTLSSPINAATDVCPGNGATLNWTPSSSGFLPSSYQLFFGTNNPPTNIVNGTIIGNVTTYNTGPLASNTTYYWQIVPVNIIGSNNTCTTAHSFTTQNINITSTNSPVTSCLNTATLTATGSGTLNWYNSSTGGSSLGTGGSYNATFSGNSTFYVGASTGSFTNYTGGKPTWDATCDYYYGYGTSEYGLAFTASVPFTLNSVDVYVETTGSNVRIRLQDGTGTNIGSVLIFSSLPSGLNTLPLNLSIPAAGNYRLVSMNSTYLGYDDNGCTTVSFPYTIPGVLSITSSTDIYGTDVTEYDYFYNWKITTGTSCECARVPVNIIHIAPSITITPSGPTTFPLGGSVGLTAASTATPGYTYTWSPATGLNTTTGASVIATPLVTTVYTVIGTNGTPCTQSATVTVDVIQPCTGLGTGYTTIASLPYNITGQTTTGMVDDITSSNALVCGSSSYYSGNDVVYSFTPTTSGSVTISVTSAGSYTGLMLYEGCPMNGQGGICITYDQSSSGSKSICVTVDAGSAYYLVIDSYNYYTGTNPYDLNISAPDPNATPNDLPCNAELINSGDLTPGDNSCASSVGEPSPPSCWTNGNINTVWYKLTTGAAQTSIKIKTIVGTLLNTQIAIYSGACGSGMSFVACNDDGASCGSSQYYNSELTTTVSPSTTYYIAVDGYDNLYGTFSIVWIDGAASWPAVPGQDCVSGVPVCASTFAIGNPGYQAVGNICDFGDDYCLLTGERGSAWYEITVNANGDLMFTIEPNDVVPPIGTAGVVTDDGTDYDWAIWKKTGSGSVTCTQIASGTSTPLRCNYSSIGITGLYTGGNNPTALNTFTNHTYSSGTYNGAYETPLPVLNGEVYWLVISNFSNSLSGFTINFNNSTNGFNFVAPNPLIWTGGAASTDWFNPLNWGNCAIIPSATIDCIVAASSIYQPVINAAGAVCKSITINPGANLTINATRNLDVYGNYNNQGTLNANSSSTVTMTGTAAQTMDGIMTMPSEFGNLTINKTAASVQLNQNIETTANLTTSSATSILNTNSNYVTIAGNIALNSPATYTNVGTTGTLEMNGSAAQIINAGSGTLALCNFIMKNTNGGVTTNNDIQLNTSGVFTLTNGIITTGANKIIVLNTASTSTSNGTSTSFVNGNLRRHIVSNTNTYAFPVGAGSAYRLAEIVNNNLTPTSYFDSKFLTSFTNTGSLNPSTAVDAGTVYNSIASEGIWQIDPNTAPTGGSYSINLWFNGGGTNAFSGLTDNQFGPLKRISTSTSASDWTALGGTLNTANTPGRTVAGGYARRNNWSAFSHFAIGKTLYPLPIELLSFNGYCNPANVELKWSTSQEVNNDFFTLEQSMDGIHFLPLGNISGAGNSNNQNNYSFIDNSYNSGIANSIYYRIKQTDFDGRTTISETISVHCTEVNSNDNIFIINQPESEDIQINFTGKIGQTYKVSFIDYLGRSLSSQEIVLQNNEQSVSIDKTGLAIGLYHLVIRSETNVYSKQVVITNH